MPIPRQVPLSEVPPMPRDQISFDIVKAQVFQNHCLACHSAGGGNAGNLNLETYENFLSKKNEVRSTVLNRTMPPSNAPSLKLSESQILLITDWIDAGAKKGEESKPTDPVVNPPVSGEGPFYFSDVLENVLKTNCNGCHSVAGGNRGRLNLETYANVFAAREKVKSDIEKGFMPPRRGVPLTADQKKMIVDWIDAGALEFAN